MNHTELKNNVFPRFPCFCVQSSHNLPILSAQSHCASCDFVQVSLAKARREDGVPLENARALAACSSGGRRQILRVGRIMSGAATFLGCLEGWICILELKQGCTLNHWFLFETWLNKVDISWIRLDGDWMEILRAGNSDLDVFSEVMVGGLRYDLTKSRMSSKPETQAFDRFKPSFTLWWFNIAIENGDL